MTCERFKDLMMAALDGEISPSQLAELESHLAGCEECRRELAKLTEVTHLLGRIELPRPSEEDMMSYWPSVYARIERGMGWGLLVIGAVIWIGYGVYAFVTDPGVGALTKLLVALPIVGVLVLLLSVIRERYHVSKTERYKEVQR
jgi:predicted anti-sigma-YlaC factor YlaD